MKEFSHLVVIGDSNIKIADTKKLFVLSLIGSKNGFSVKKLWNPISQAFVFVLSDTDSFKCPLILFVNKMFCSVDCP